MKGMDYIISLRENRLQPALVILDTRPYESDLTPDWLQVEPHDVPELIDLRPLVGLTVAIAMPTAEECEPWVKAVMAADADTVLVSPHDGPTSTRRLVGVDL